MIVTFAHGAGYQRIVRFANYQAMFTPGMQGAYVEHVTVALRAFTSLAVLAGYLRFVEALSYSAVAVQAGGVGSSARGDGGAGIDARRSTVVLHDTRALTCSLDDHRHAQLPVGHVVAAHHLCGVCRGSAGHPLGTVSGVVRGHKDGATIVSYIVFGSALLLLTGLSAAREASKFEPDFNRPDEATARGGR